MLLNLREAGSHRGRARCGCELATGSRAGPGERGRPHTPTSLGCPTTPAARDTHSSLCAGATGSGPRLPRPVATPVHTLSCCPAHHVCAAGCRAPAVLPLLGDVVIEATQTHEGRRPQGKVETGLGWTPGPSVIHPHLLGQAGARATSRSTLDTPNAGVISSSPLTLEHSYCKSTYTAHEYPL